MVMIKSLFVAGFMLASAFANATPESVPAIATLQVQSNFDFSLIRKEFRVHYSALEGATGSVDINIYKKNGNKMHTFTVTDASKSKAYQFALEAADAGAYEVEVCADTKCSGKSAALTEIPVISDQNKLTCNRGNMVGEKWVDSSSTEIEFVGLTKDDWIPTTEFQSIENLVNGALKAANKTANYETDYKKYGMSKNPDYKRIGETDGIFYTAVKYDASRYRQLFDKIQPKGGPQQDDYAHEFCERKYLMSAHAHLVDKVTHEVQHRFKTTLFLSEGGKQMYVLRTGAEKVHIELTHKNVDIKAGSYRLWITLCATEKDAIESTFCADPIVHEQDFTVVN